MLAFMMFSFITGVGQTDQKAASKNEINQEKITKEDKKLKKDGTPDMCYKENKDAAKPAGPLKKDGTPDKRYKENKENKK